MKNKKVILSVLAGIVIAGAIIAWLMLSGDKPITVKYSSEKYLRSKSFIENNIENISNLDFDSHIQKNKNHCKFCEFNKLCNNQNINYDMISEMEEEDD